MKDNFWDWVLIILAAVAGVAARMGHTWSKRAEEAAATGTVSRGISLAETISAVVTARRWYHCRRTRRLSRA